MKKGEDSPSAGKPGPERSSKKHDPGRRLTRVYLPEPIRRKVDHLVVDRGGDISDLTEEVFRFYLGHRVPVIGEIAAGKPIVAEERAEYYIEPAQIAEEGQFALQVRGESMAPTLMEGDLCIIREQPQVEEGEIAAVRIDDEATVKRVRRHNGRYVLASDNPAYEDIEVDRAQVVGRVVRVLRRV